MRRGDPGGARRQLVIGAPPWRAVIVRGVVVLHPDPPQRLDRRNLAQPCRGRRRPHRLQELRPIRADLERQRLAGRRVGRQAVGVQPSAVAVGPRGWARPMQPVRCHRRERVQRVAQRLADRLQPVEGPDRRHHRGRVGPLPPARPDQPRRPTARQQQVEEQRLLRAHQQPRAERAQHRVVEAGVVQRQAERVLPVDPASHRLGGLAVGEPLGERHQRHQRHLRRGEGGLPARREERRKVPIGVEAAQLVVHPQVDIALGEGCPCHPRGVLRHQLDGLRVQRHDSPPPLTHRDTFRRAADSIPQPPPVCSSQFANGIEKGQSRVRVAGEPILW